MNKINIKIPRLNANDDEVEVVDVHINNGEKIKEGQKLFTFETTKTSVDFNSEYDGIINGISAKKGNFLKVGDLICTINTNKIIKKQKNDDEIEDAKKNFEGTEKKISAKALKLIKKNALDIKKIKITKDKITSEDIIDYLNKKKIKNTISKKSFIVGCGGHSLTVADIVLDNGWDLQGFCAKNKSELGNKILNELKVIANDDDFLNLKKKNISTAFIGILGATSNSLRKSVFDLFYEKNFSLPALISKRAFISKSSTVGDGTIILPGAMIGPKVHIGKNCLINYNATICHESIIEDHVHLAPNSALAGNCFIGESSTVGMCSTIYYSVKIGKNCLTHNNSSVTTDLSNNYEINKNGKIFKRKKN
tara:strand:+ start:4146 stop:5240 length:1095 start_codon:yes stop_codon:yes gene_type:complete